MTTEFTPELSFRKNHDGELQSDWIEQIVPPTEEEQGIEYVVVIRHDGDLVFDPYLIDSKKDDK